MRVASVPEPSFLGLMALWRLREEFLGLSAAAVIRCHLDVEVACRERFMMPVQRNTRCVYHQSSTSDRAQPSDQQDERMPRIIKKELR